MKHYVRIKGWLPRCRSRGQLVKKNSPYPRRLRYFTFCAINAVDVLMLDVARVLQPSRSSHKFDTVVFFDRTDEAVVETQKRIPGAIGFTGSFTDVVLAARDTADDFNEAAALAPVEDEENTKKTRAKQIRLAEHHRFQRCFPFDIINLDLEEIVFKPKDEFPGRVIAALRRVFRWQTLTGTYRDGAHERPVHVDGYTLMFTTRIVGPEFLGDDYRELLRTYMVENVTNRPELLEMLKARVPCVDLQELESRCYAEYYKIALRKALAKVLLEEDWYVDDSLGIKTYEFVRTVDAGPYTMLHFVMEIKRKSPEREKRGPGVESPAAIEAYVGVVSQLFRDADEHITEDLALQVELRPSLEQIARRRRKYMPTDL